MSPVYPHSPDRGELSIGRAISSHLCCFKQLSQDEVRFLCFSYRQIEQMFVALAFFTCDTLEQNWNISGNKPNFHGCNQVLDILQADL